MPYVSLFARAQLITKADMYTLLNLNRQRTDFSAEEINKAFRKRALRFHPDTQQGFSPDEIPVPDCTTLLDDIAKAKEYLIKGEDNIPGTAFKEKSISSGNLLGIVISMLKGLKDGSAATSKTVYWANLLSNTFLIAGLFSTFSNGQSNFHYAGVLSKALSPVKPYLKDINGEALAAFLNTLKEQLEHVEELDEQKLQEALRLLLPVSLANEEQLSELAAAIKESGIELKSLLTDRFIARIKRLVNFWCQLIVTMPSWLLIFNVYALSLHVSANSLPKYFSAMTVISQIIIEHKGVASFIFFGLPMWLYALVALPYMMGLSLFNQIVLLSLKTAFNGIGIAFNLLFSILSLPFVHSGEGFIKLLFSLCENIVNLTLRLPLVFIMESIDVVLFILTNQKYLGSAVEYCNNFFNTMFGHTPKDTNEKQLVPTKKDEAPEYGEKPNNNNKKPPSQSHSTGHTTNFFAEQPLYNAEDTFLDELLQSFKCETPEEQAIPMNAAA